MNSVQSLRRPIILWLVASLFFFFQFILRLSPGILREEIIQRFSIDTVAFGTLAGYYYLGYAGMQIPLGILLDKYSFRFVTFGSIMVSSIGTLIFVAATDWHYLLLGRFLIGAGSAVGFLSVAKIIKAYFPPKHHSLMIGCSFTFGLLGAAFGVTPMKILFNHFGYVHTFNFLALVGLIIGGMVLVFNTDYASEQSMNNNDNGSGSFTQVFKLLLNPKILLIGICSGLMVGSLDGFTDIWGIPFFKQIYNFSDIDSNSVISLVYIGMCFGGPILVLLSDFFKSSTLVIFLSGLFTIILFVILSYSANFSFVMSATLMFILGVLCCYQVLVIAITGNMVSKSSAGLAIAIINCLNMAFGHFFHKIISTLIEKSWDGTVNELGLPIYSRQDFTTSLSVIPICCLLGMIGFLYIAWQGNRVKKESAINY